MLNQDASASKPWFRQAAEVEVNRLLDRNIISDVMLETAKAKLAQASAYGSIVANITELYIPGKRVIGSLPFKEGSLVNLMSKCL
jgi:membrane fusion protein (multidrug efflux system)